MGTNEEEPPSCRRITPKHDDEDKSHPNDSPWTACKGEEGATETPEDSNSTRYDNSNGGEELNTFRIDENCDPSAHWAGEDAHTPARCS